MKVVILCGGFGSRIREISENIPKPMIPIGKFPILWHIMKYYAHWNYKDFVLCLGYKGHVIKDFFLNYRAHTSDFTIDLGGKKTILYHNDSSELDWQVTFAETGLEALTGARVKRIKQYVINDDNFMLTYGDGVGDINIDKLVDFHKSHGKILTVTGVKPPGRFGEIVSENTGKITEFNEKPQSTSGKISGGFFVCRKKLFDYLDDRENLTFEQEPMRKLVRDGQMMLYEHDGFWQCMDTNRDFLYLKGLTEKGEAPWVVW
jgi:glucose-1-phosphate cytidylyltransferase